MSHPPTEPQLPGASLPSMPAATPPSMPPSMPPHTPATPTPRSEFELRAADVLEASTARLDGRIRSRLNQARHAALDAHAARSRSPLTRLLGNRSAFAPAGAVAAVAVLALVLWTGQPVGQGPLGALSGDGAVAIEDLDLLADNDALELAGEADVEFYEWALAETDSVSGNGPIGT